MSQPRVLTLLGVLLAIVFGGGILLGITEIDDARWESQTVVTIDQPRAIAEVPSAGILDKLGRLRFKYAGLLRTRELQDPIAERLETTPQDVAGRLTTIVPNESLLLVLVATSADPQAASDLSNAAASELVSYVQREQDAADIPEANRFVFRTVTVSDIARNVTSPSREAAPIVASALGLLLALALIVLGRRRA